MTDLVLVFVQAAHLLCVNVSVGGPLVCLWLEWREARADALAGRVGRFLAWTSLLLYVIGMGLGLLLGWLLWTPAYATAVERLGSRAVFGIWELAFSLVLLAVYAFWWQRSRAAGRWQRLLRATLPLMAGTNLLYHFPPLFAILSSFSGRGEMPAVALDSAGFRQLMFSGEVLSRAVHFWLASMAVTGGVLILFAVKHVEPANRPANDARVAVWGARLALVSTLLQIPVGLWLLVELSPFAMNALLGHDLLTTSLFVVSIVLALLLMHLLANVALGTVTRKALLWSVGVLLLVVLLMTATLHYMQRQRSGDVHGPAPHGVQPTAACVSLSLGRRSAG